MAGGREHGANGLQEHAGALEEGRAGGNQAGCENSEQTLSSTSKQQPMLSVQFVQKILAEIFGTYFLIFAGCAAVSVNLRTAGTVTFPGICITWGLTCMVMIYSVGHISGAHFNPAVTLAFATCGRFPWRQVPAYMAAQVLGSTGASITLRLLFGSEHFFGTVPSESDVQSLVLEFIITFLLMFVVSGVATDNRAVNW
ncbi:unnamed protein product [Alopecurus aequalis]